MFDFEKMRVYQESRIQIRKIYSLIISQKLLNWSMKNQIIRASTSVVANIAEGAGKTSRIDKRRFYSIARGSSHECIAFSRFYTIEDSLIQLNTRNCMRRLKLSLKCSTGL